MNTKEVCVFGSEGLLGKAVVESAINAGYYVKGIDRLDNSKKTNHERWKYVCIDMQKTLNDNKMEEVIDNIINPFTTEGIINCMLPKSKNQNGYDHFSQECLNLFGIDYSLCNSIVAKLISQNGKRPHCKMIHISSIKARRPPKFWQYKDIGMGSDVLYGSMKAALNYFIEDCASRYANQNISFAGIAPAGILGEKHSKIFLNRYNSSVSNGGLVPPSVIAEFIIDVLKTGPYLNGVTIDIDAGWKAIDGRRI